MTSTPSKITVIFDANPLLGNRTGVGNYTHGLLQALSDLTKDKNIELIGYYYDFLGIKRPPLLSAANIKYHRIVHVPGRIINTLRRFSINIPLELLIFRRADFILYPNFWGPRPILRTPSAIVIHDLSYLDHPEFVADRNASDLRREVPTALSKSSFVITVSQFSKDRIVSAYKVPPEKILTTFIPPYTRRNINNERCKELLYKNGIDKPYILFVGTLEPRKNLVALMDAYDQLPDQIQKDYSLIIAGKVDWKASSITDRIKQLTDKGRDIRHLGYIDDVTRTALYQGASLFVLPSLYEGFGMPILEALSLGTPCAVSNIPPFHEVAGSTAAYFNPNDPSSIASSIEFQLIHPRKMSKSQSLLPINMPTWSEVAQEVFHRITNAIKQEH